MKLQEIADRIRAHLARFEKDPVHSRNSHGSARFWNSGVVVAGRFIKVCYVSYQNWTSLTKDEALRYLAMLDAGYIGRHFEAFREPTK